METGSYRICTNGQSINPTSPETATRIGSEIFHRHKTARLASPMAAGRDTGDRSRA